MRAAGKVPALQFLHETVTWYKRSAVQTWHSDNKEHSRCLSALHPTPCCALPSFFLELYDFLLTAVVFFLAQDYANRSVVGGYSAAHDTTDRDYHKLELNMYVA